jgi:hypothetical protein
VEVSPELSIDNEEIKKMDMNYDGKISPDEFDESLKFKHKNNLS